MNKLFKKSISWTFAVVSVLFTFIPEKLFESMEFVPEYIGSLNEWWIKNTSSVDVVICRIFVFLFVWIAAFAVVFLQKSFKRKVVIRGENYTISVEYGDIFKQKNCQTVIPFDECFTSKVGNAPEEIKRTSICGQYLEKHADLDVAALISQSKLVADVKKSRFQNKERYLSGSIIPAGSDLLMAFAPLDENGKGVFTCLEDYKDSLDLMWKEIYKYSGQNDVCIPILGSGITHFDGSSGAGLSQQELLNLIIYSYKLSTKKLKKPYKLRIICKRVEGFSLDNIDIN